MGYKLYTGPDFHLRRMRNAHRMNGLYIKPKVAFAYYDQHYNTSSSLSGGSGPYKKSFLKSAMILELGRQHVFGDIISVDYNLGLGYGTKSVTESPSSDDERLRIFDFDNNYNFGVLEGSGFAFSSSLKVGFLLK